MRCRTPRLVLLAAVAAGILGLCSARVSAKVPYIFQPLNNALGHADRQGYCSVWWFFDEKVDAGAGIELPICLQFNSRQRYFADSCVGAGWWFPLLESTVVRENEESILVHLPGGHVIRLYLSQTEPGKFRTKDQTRTGTLEGGTFRLEGKDGWQFTYEAGRLKEARTPGGDAMQWEYAGNRVSRITSKNQGPLLEARYDAATGLIEEVTFNEGRERVRFGHADAPLKIAAKAGDTTNHPLKSLASVKSRGFSATITFQSVDEARSLEMVVNHASDNGTKGMDKYRWSATDGLIQSDNFGPYIVRGGGVDAGDAVFYVENVTREGKKKSYQYDRKKMEEVHGAADGRKFVYQYVDTPGPAFGKLRRVTDIMPDGKETIPFIGLFDQTGNLRRTMNGSGRETDIANIDSLDPAEAIPLMCKFAKGEREDFEVIGPKGKLVGAVLDGVPYVFIHAEDGKLLDRPTMMSYLRSHPEIKIPAILPAWLQAAMKNEGEKGGRR